jgi:hypothetical protein
MSVTAQQAEAFARRIEAIAEDVGRLRRRFASNESAWTGLAIVGSLAHHVDALDAFLQPTAADIYAANLWECGDEQESVTAALEDVDRRVRHFRMLLGEKRVA